MKRSHTLRSTHEQERYDTGRSAGFFLNLCVERRERENVKKKLKGEPQREQKKKKRRGRVSFLLLLAQPKNTPTLLQHTHKMTHTCTATTDTSEHNTKQHMVYNKKNAQEMKTLTRLHKQTPCNHTLS